MDERHDFGYPLTFDAFVFGVEACWPLLFPYLLYLSSWVWDHNRGRRCLETRSLSRVVLLQDTFCGADDRSNTHFYCVDLMALEQEEGQYLSNGKPDKAQ